MVTGKWILYRQNKKETIVTIVERTTGTHLMEKFSSGKNARKFANRVKTILIQYKKCTSIISDNGKEFAEHPLIAQKLHAEYYFAHLLFFMKKKIQ